MIGVFPADDDIFLWRDVTSVGCVEDLAKGHVTETCKQLRFHPGMIAMVTVSHDRTYPLIIFGDAIREWVILGD